MFADLEELETIEPLVRAHLKVPGGAVAFETACFGGAHWSLAKLSVPDDALKHPTFAEEVGAALHLLGARRAYAFNPTAFNGIWVEPERLLFPIVLPYAVILYRNRELPADATSLRRPGDAGVFSAGGCGMLMIACEDMLIFAHAGRESLIDRERVLSLGMRGRGKDLVDNIVESIVSAGLRIRDAHVWPMYFIKPRDFVHSAADPDPKHAEYNRAAMRYLPRRFGSSCGTLTPHSIRIDLPHIAARQFSEYGVPPEHLHMEHCYLADELPTTRSGGGRYLVAAVRTA